MPCFATSKANSAPNILVPALALWASACAHSSPAPDTDPVEARVMALRDRAREEEPAVTARLTALASARGGALHKLEHRLKTQRSAVRKLRLELEETPSKAPSDVVLTDMLRYTMRIDDAPKGGYVAAIASILSTLEAAGHQVLVVKNYWPRGDNYSGVNSVLRTPSGLPWELQFHTRDSLEVQSRSRERYEELRDADTARRRKRALFDEMAEMWDAVAIPSEVLEQGNLHPKEEIKRMTRP